MNTYGPLLVGVLLVIGGSLAMVRGVAHARRARLSRGWPTAPAEILRMEMYSYQLQDRTRHKLDLRYSYEVGGVTYESERASYFPVDTKDEISAFIQEHREVRPRAHYNPDDPGDAVLAVYGRKPYHVFFMGLILTLVGAGLVWMGLGRL